MENKLTPPGPVSWARIPVFCLTPHRPLYPQKRIQVLVSGAQDPCSLFTACPTHLTTHLGLASPSLMPALLFLKACSALGCG